MRSVCLSVLCFTHLLVGQELVEPIPEAPVVPPPPQTLYEMGLAEWSEQELADLHSGAVVPGSSLLGKVAMSFLDSPNNSVIEVDPEILNLPDEEPEGVLSKDIPAEFLASYFDHPSLNFLHDPQRLLVSQERSDREGFLSYHARDTEISLFVYLFDAEQELPVGASIEGVVEKHFDENDSVAVIFYYLGRPERSQLAFTKAVSESVSLDERKKVLRLAVEEASHKEEPASQLENFSIQLSMRLYWLEKLMNRGEGALLGSMVLPGEVSPDELKKRDRFASFRESPELRYAALFIVVAIPTFLIGFGWRWYAKKNCSYLFPDAEGDALLDAPQAAGVGAVISFASAHEPPASQKRHVPEYLEHM